MTMKRSNDLGDISITSAAIASLTGTAVSECYGVIGMASKHILRDGFTVLLGKNDSSKGVVVKKSDKGLELDIYIIICYGVKVTEVVSEVQKKVKYELENALDIDFCAINVYVQGVRAID